MREFKYSFDSLITNIGVKNVIANYMPFKLNESMAFEHNFVDCNNDDQYMNATPGH